MRIHRSHSLIPITLVFIFLLSVALISEARIEAVLGPVPLAKNPNLPQFIPQSQDSEIIISRDQYVISYDSQRRVPHWVAWKLESSNIGNTLRANDFRADAELDSYLEENKLPRAVKPSEYDGSCFDRGHQAPSKDRTDSIINNQATFFMSNMIPQTPYLNRTLWEHLEQYTRDQIVKFHKKAYIIAGPIFDLNYGRIGPNADIAVPSKNFKLIFFVGSNQDANDIDPSAESIAVIMPNNNHDGSQPAGNADHKACQELSKTSAPPSEQKVNLAIESLDDWKAYQSNFEQIKNISGLQFVEKKIYLKP